MIKCMFSSFKNNIKLVKSLETKAENKDMTFISGTNRIVLQFK